MEGAQEIETSSNTGTKSEWAGADEGDQCLEVRNRKVVSPCVQ